MPLSPRLIDPLRDMSDERLVDALAAGEREALEELYDRYVRGCYGLALKIVREPTVAEEVVQDVFMKLWSRPDSYKAERGKFSGWLLTLVHNRSVDRLRRAKSGGQSNMIPLDLDNGSGLTPAGALPDSAPTPDEEALRQEQSEAVQTALRLLPDSQREAITLAYFGGLTQKEISERLGEPLGTIKTRTRSGLARLRHLLLGQGVLGDAA